MTPRALSLRCEGCGAAPPPLREAPLPLRCARRGADAVDHVMAPELDPSAAAWPAAGGDRPFVRYRRLLHAHAAALEAGLGDEGYLALVERLEAAIERVDGRSFRATPLVRAPAIADVLGLGGEVWVKDDTGNVSGSHKGRHLFGVLLHLSIVAAAGLLPLPSPTLAIASCGNAALAAGVLAAAAGRSLLVLVPPDVPPSVAARLAALDADVRVVERDPGEVGDPTVRAFRTAVEAGAVPFACQGTECGLALDGGKTLGFELVASGVPFDRIFVQVGGGALASCVGRAFDDALRLGAIAKRPRLMAVQTASVAPLPAAYARFVSEVRRRTAGTDLPADVGDALADRLRSEAIVGTAEAVLDEMARDRASWLPAWQDPRPSLARGILDDETYDAMAILRAMLATGGSPVVVDEKDVSAAQALGRGATGIDVDATGTAGLAGLMAWSQRRVAAGDARGERIALLFTGASR